ncbi:MULTISPECIES: SRPBCC family protein [Streptomyces]|uniref:SRPBCC family protein n=1 Tax=Streptomyces solicathayae TaxID=3081768 RepID=A0ABZ0LX05_9ACTN|nr:SRPBCC family protein [Streptomyces sp. HUAS YS2]WOX23997.1 SRPBCC family protein [Streptomyces sp. HUAS YS2]
MAATKSVVVERRVQAPPGPVWEALTDLRGMERVLSGVERVEVLTAGGFDVGTRWRETRRMMGKEATEEMTVTECVPPERYVTVADSHGMHYVSEIELLKGDPESASTMIVMTFRATPTGGGAMGLLAKLVGGLGAKAVSRALAKDLDEIAAAIERRG